jgi:hypothetical protein
MIPLCFGKAPERLFTGLALELGSVSSHIFLALLHKLGNKHMHNVNTPELALTIFN